LIKISKQKVKYLAGVDEAEGGPLAPDRLLLLQLYLVKILIKGVNDSAIN
jgi:hypothetical protein